jgi:hypothetical protein
VFRVQKWNALRACNHFPAYPGRAKDLLKLLKQSEGEEFNKKHVMYFLQPSNEGYIKRQVRGIPKSGTNKRLRNHKS